MICIYHSKDLDGIASGAIVKMRYPDCTLIGWDYGDPIPELPEEENIMMVDVTFPIPIMRNMRYRLTVIDHHKSFIEEWNKAAWSDSTTLKGLRRNELAACELTWEYCFPSIPTPEWVSLLGMYDTWRNFGTYEWNELILPFQYGMRMFVSKPEDLLENTEQIDTIISNGKIILNHVKHSDAFNCTKNAFEVQFEGLRAICVNLPGVNTMTFDSVYDELKHDIMLAFNYTGSHWSVSLRAKRHDIDCSAIARKYGGGGHRAAAGFEVDDINKIIKNE